MRAVGVDADLDPRLYEMGAHRARRDLQFQRAIGDGIVVHDLALFLDAEDFVEIDARDRDEGRAHVGRRHGEAGVVGGQIDLADEGVGRLDRGDPGQRQFLDQTILKRPERPLGAAPGLRRIGPDMLDAQLLQRPPDLSRMIAVDPAAVSAVRK